MKTIKKIAAIILCVSLLLALAGCGEPKKTGASVSVTCLSGPTGIGMANLMAKSEKGETANDYTFSVASNASDITGDIISGKINIASVPTNVAAALYNKTKGKIRMLAVNTYGVLTVLEKGSTIKSISDLKGKTIYATGQKQNPQYILEYLLNKNDIDPEKDITINYVSGENLVAKLISGEVEVAIAPEPAATTAMISNTKLKRAISINDAWSDVSDADLMMGCVIALDSYVESNPEAIKAFLDEYEDSIKKAKKNVEETANHCATYKITASEAIAQKVIPNCNLTYITANDMKEGVEGYLSVLVEADASSIGGALPEDEFYYNAK